MIAKDSSLIPAADQAAGPIKIGLMSDLHLEFEQGHRNRVLEKIRRGDPSLAAKALAAMRMRENEAGHPENGPDLRALKQAAVDFVLLPGDIDVAGRGVRYADAVAQYLGCPVYMCWGNHDGYGADLELLIAEGRRVEAETHGRVVVLERSRADLVVKGRKVAIYGATLWTDYYLASDLASAMERAGRALNDHTRIRFGDEWLSPREALEIHLETKAWLEKELMSPLGNDDVRVVISHHAPIPEAIPPRYRGDALSPAFASDLRSEIEAWKPDLWVWGHTHNSMETRVGATRMVSAQRGYVGVEPGAESFVPVILEI
jgi:predicted phosphodiesterase